MTDKTDLRKLLTYENPRREEYEDFINQEHNKGSVDLRRSFSEFWPGILEDNKNMAGLFKESLTDNILVDLGCGYPSYKWIRGIAGRSGAKTYIGVDKYMAEQDKFPEGPFTGIELGERPVYPDDSLLVKADLLDFVSRLPSNSVNFAMNGIDSNILKTSKYIAAVAEEMARATQKGGIVFGINSRPVDYLTRRAEENGFKTSYGRDLGDDTVLLKEG